MTNNNNNVNPVAIDLDKLALALGRTIIENIVLQQQLEALQQPQVGQKEGFQGPSFPLEMDHDKVPSNNGTKNAT